MHVAEVTDELRIVTISLTQLLAAFKARPTWFGFA